MPRMKPLFLDTTDMTVEAMETWGKDLIELQKFVNWGIGDLALAAKAKLGEDNYTQVFPVDTSPGLVQRCLPVSQAYPREEDRNPMTSWTVHAKHKNSPDRIALVQASVDAGRTSDEEREHLKESGQPNEEPPKQPKRWLLAIDVNYHLTRMWASGAETEAAREVSEWITRTVGRLKEKGLTDVVCCLDSPNSFRKYLTKEWEDNYKPRATKDPELKQQLHLIEGMLSDFCCAKLDGFEADDLLASYAKQFDGKVTLLTVDKDMRQCLSAKCNMLVDVEWSENPNSGDMLADYKWVTAKGHVEGCTYSGVAVKGISPAQWTSFQCLAGDSSDGISGVSGIGAKSAADLINEFGTVEAVIQAAKDDDPRIKPKKRESLIEFAGKLEVTKQLVTLRTDLQLPTTTKIT